MDTYSRRIEEETYQTALADVEDDDDYAKSTLAWFLLSGRGGAKVDPDQAVALLEERVKDKDEEAMWMLGVCCEFGLGTEQRIRRAKLLYNKSPSLVAGVLQRKRENCCLLLKPFDFLMEDIPSKLIPIAPWRSIVFNGKITYKFGRRLEDEGIAKVCECLKNNTTITELYLGFNLISPKGISHLCDFLKVNESLMVLDLRSNSIKPEGASILCKTLMDNTILNTLFLGGVECYTGGGNLIGDEGAKSVSELLKKNSSLTILDLGENEIGVKGASSLSEALKVNTTLTKLGIGFNNLGSEGLTKLCEALTVNTSLTQINMWGNKIKGVNSLSNMLKKNSTLSSLHLGANEIEDEGIKKICESLMVNTTLTSLVLAGNKIGWKGAKTISEFLMVNTTLTSLNLVGNDIGRKGATAIREALKTNTVMKKCDIS